MPRTLTTETAISLRTAGHTYPDTLGGFFSANADDPEFDRAGVFAALARGEVYRGGGGAAGGWTVELEAGK